MSVGSFGWLADRYEIAKCNERCGIDLYRNIMFKTFVEKEPDRLAWELEEAFIGSVLPSWNQKQVGSCVGFGSTRCFQDSLLYEKANDPRDIFPGELAPEVSYGGGRVEIGGGRISGDGSLGVWSAEFFKRYGTLIRADHGGGNKDLRTYREDNCRWWGRYGVPDDLEAECKKHGMVDYAVISSFDDCLSAWKRGLIGTYCGTEAYQTRRGQQGICRRDPRNSWAHCQYYRGVLYLTGNQPVIVVQNSWGDYVGSDNNRVRLENGRELTLPQGAYCVVPEDANRQFKSRDSHIYTNVTEWEVTRPNWRINWAVTDDGVRIVA